MTKTRLLKDHKTELKRFARQKVTVPKSEQKIIDDLYKKVSKMVISFLKKEYPEKDMLILKKYDMAQNDTCIQFMVPNTTLTVVWTFKNVAEEGVPMVPRSRHCSWHNKVHDGGDDLPKLIDEHKKLLKKAEEGIAKRVADYYTLIEHCRTLEEIFEVWPEAREIEQSIRGYALPAVLSSEVVDRIKADQALREKEAA